MSASAIYLGRVMHHRHLPHRHTFNYRIAQLLLDLDELDTVFGGHRLWSVNRRNLAEFRRSDHFGDPDQPLIDSVRDTVQSATGERPNGPVRLLTHLRYAGYVFNPVSFYYCHVGDGSLHSIVADITNTPWNERHQYVLPVAQAQQHGRSLYWRFDKRFHVSPFLPMDCQYRWRLTAPAERLQVHMQVWRQDRRQFDANLAMHRRPLDARGLRGVLLRYPLMTLQVIGAIHWQALRLWLKRNPVHDHPSLSEDTR